MNIKKIAFLFAALVTTACASGGAKETTGVNPEVEQMVTCYQQHKSCFAVHVSNDSRYELDVRINGWKLGNVSGNEARAFAVPTSVLKNDRCVTATLHAVALGGTVTSETKCMNPNGYFTLRYDVEGVVWLTPWDAR